MSNRMRLTLNRATSALFLGLVLGGSLGIARPALAGSRFDGTWNLTFVTQRGACDAAYNFTVDVLNENVSHPNILTFRAMSLRRVLFTPRLE